MRSRHHLFPKCHRKQPDFFFNLQAKKNISVVSEQEHRAWNILTHDSQMSLGETAESLNRFIPTTHKFVIVRR
jgi:hypothetical protein